MIAKKPAQRHRAKIKTSLEELAKARAETMLADVLREDETLRCEVCGCMLTSQGKCTVCK